MTGTHLEHLGLCIVLTSLLGCRVASQNGCALLKNEYIIDISLTEAPKGSGNSFERTFLGFRGAAGSITLDVEQDDSAIDFNTNFRIFLGIADFNYGFCIQRIGDLDRDGQSSKYSDDNNILEYTIVCTELSTSNKYYYPLLIRIADLNDNAPMFQNEPYEITVDAKTENGATLIRVVATDKDIDKNRHVVYGVVKGSGALNDASKYFHFPVISSGALSLKKKINVGAFKREGITSMTLNVFAMDMGRKSLRTDSSIKVHIQYDEDVIEKIENKPEHEELPTSGNCVLVDLPAFSGGTIKVKLPEVISETDLTAHPHRYRGFIGIEDAVTSLTLEPPSNNVRIEYIIPRTGSRGYYIRFITAIDRDGQTGDKRDDTNTLNFNLTCQSNNIVVVFPLNIHITDENDNTPVLDGKQLQFTIVAQKDKELPVEVYNILSHSTITDIDAGVNRQVTFGVVFGDEGVLDASRYFTVNGNSGIISQVENIDYNAILKAGSTTLMINVSITDNARNVHKRRTSYWIIKAMIEHFQPTTTFIPARCKLDDSEFDYEDERLVISILEPMSVNDLTEYADIFTKYIGFDSDANLSLVKDEAGEFNPNLYFKLITKGDKQFIRMFKPLDRDGITPSTEDDNVMVNFVIECKPDGELSHYPVRIYIEDSNDNPPEFQNTPYVLNVNEDTKAGIVVYGSILATDRDSGANREIQYAIVPGDGSQNDISKYFDIHNPAEGKLTLVKTMDFEKLATKTFQLNISATNNVPSIDKLVSYTTIDITVTDSDDQDPVFVYNSCLKSAGVCVNPRYTASIKSGIVSGRLTVYPVPENELNTSINIRATDQDSLKNAIIFSIDESVPNGYIDSFTVESTKHPDADEYTALVNQVKIIKRINVQNLTLFIKATEISAHGRSQRAELSITTLQTNLNPPSITTSSGNFVGYVRENDKNGSFVFSSEDESRTRLNIQVSDLDASPSDPPPTYSYSLSPNNVFGIDEEGYIRTIDALDYEVTPQYILQVTVTEADTSERHSTTAALTIHVQDVNDNSPIFLQKTVQVNITEGDYSTSPRALIKVHAVDADSQAGGSVTYSILDVRPDEGDIFNINKESGAIDVIGKLIPNTVYSIRVQSVDNGTPPRSSVSVVEIYTEPKPNSAPHFLQSQYRLSIRENQQVDSQLLQLSASDPDGDDLQYTISSGNLGQVFSIDSSSGILSVYKMLDYESIKIKSYVLTITATDERGLEASTVTHIDVIDSNDNSPVFSSALYEVGVIEGDYSSSPKVIVEVSASDADSDENSELVYSIIKLNPDEIGKISLDPHNGEVELVGYVKGDTKYMLTVQASDAGNPSRSSIAEVVITIIPLTVSNNAPIIPQSVYRASVSEGTALASEILQISASDPDNDNLQYSIISQNPATSTFQIDSRGVITNVELLDREIVDEYTLQVSVADSKSLTAEAKVIVTVTDMNDNPPVFSKQLYVFSIVEGQMAKYLVAAFDKDEVNTGNSLVTYSFLDTVEHFTISPDGEIISTIELDREKEELYEMVVVAKDNGIPVLSSTTTVRIHVTDIADSVPVFFPSVYEAFVPEGVTDFLVVTVRATDADETDNVIYIFEEGDTADFTLDSITGEIRNRIPLNILLRPFYSFMVTTTDGKGVSSALVSVTVQGKDIKDRDPVVSIPISPDETNIVSSGTEVVTVVHAGDNLPPVFEYPTCLGMCNKPEYAASLQSAASLISLRLFPMPSDNPTLAVPLQAQDPNDRHAEIQFTVARTVPSGLENHFILEREGPDSRGFYRAVVKQMLPLYVDKTPQIAIIIRATEQTDHRLFSEAAIYVEVERYYILEEARLVGVNTAYHLSSINLVLFIITTISTVFYL